MILWRDHCVLHSARCRNIVNSPSRHTEGNQKGSGRVLSFVACYGLQTRRRIGMYYRTNVLRRSRNVKQQDENLPSWSKKGVQSPSDSKRHPSNTEGFSLPETHENSNYILLRIPIEMHLFQRGLQGICMDPDLLPQELGLNEEAIGCLVQAGLVRLRPQKPTSGERADHAALQQTYARMLAEGPS